ncbi:hypothetical protein J7337_001451 [Fusarium musae]|uniref:Uncharacterized protein n=1 Tax=Fusarium musae TaxID=1042133 RepID=A0A9P8DTD9_9HYPO|nr:hypothetical protein J7337_001451 [Fusarium musae]KAG9507895.1 hypothetical protein J7337_001451 [Fusarium musae]
MDTALPLQQDGENSHSQDDIKPTVPAPEDSNMSNIQRHPHANRTTPEPQDDRHANNSDLPDTPGVLEPFDWDEFEARYEAALQEADEREREILKEADALSKDDLVAFHESHFSHTAVAAFGSEFVDSPSQDQTQDDAVNDTREEEEDDSLGYYPDGVKRTLTDAQIEIFRHSELETQRKEKERAKQLGLKETAPSSDVMDLSNDTPTSKQTKNMSSLLPASFQSNKKRKKKKNGLQRPRPEPKPDLRKRTWDVVDKGLDSLEYD